MFQLDLLQTTYLFSVTHGLFLMTLLLIRSKQNRANIFLALLIGLFSFYLFEQVVYLAGYIPDYPHLYFTTLPLIYLIGPLFYHFIRASVNPQGSLKWIHLTHLIPFLFELFIFIPFYRLDAAIKLKVYEGTLSSDSSWQFNIFFVGFIIYVLSTILFFYLAFRRLKSYQPASAKAKKNARSLRIGSLLFISYMLVSIGLSTYSGFVTDLDTIPLHFNLICQVLIIHSMGYISFLNPQLLSLQNGNGARYQFSSLSPERMTSLEKELHELVSNQKLHLLHDLKPEKLTQALNISKGELSQLLSEQLGTNFYRLINEYRIAEAKQLLKSEKYSDAKIIHIALDSGFSNKSSFLRNFKEATGLTPSDYRKNGFH